MKTKCSIRVLVVFLLALVSSAVLADLTTGTPPLSTIAGGPFDSIDLANLDVHFSIPVFGRKGVGMPFSYSLSYDSLVWTPVTSGGSTSWQPAPNWGWRTPTEAVSGYVSAIYIYRGNCALYPNSYSDFVYHDPSGTSHGLDYSYDACDGTTTGTGRAEDNSGYELTSFNGVTSVTIVSGSGIVIVPPFVKNNQQPSGAGSLTDPNGNQIKISAAGVVTDTLGTAYSPALSISGSPPVWSTNNPNCTGQVTYTYLAPGSSGAGAYVAVAVFYEHRIVATDFNVKINGVTVTEFPTTNECLVSTVTLPDGSNYQFSYELNHDIGGTVTGRIASVTLPTGGVISYSYAGSGCGGSGNNCMMADGSPSFMQRALSGGTWQYLRSLRAPYPTQQTFTRVIDPAGNYNDSFFSGIYRTANSAYQGSATKLDYTATCYNGDNGASTCSTETVSAPHGVTEVTTYDYPSNNTSSGLFAKHDVTFDQYGNNTSQNDYDYAATRNTLLRTVNSPYYPCNALNICDLPRYVQIEDGQGHQLALTYYYYNGTGQSYRIDRFVDYLHNLTSTFMYNPNGTVATATDPNGAVTNYSLGGYSCNGAFPNSSTVPSWWASTLTTSYAYNCGGGVVTKVTDPNNQNTYTIYKDPFFWRPTDTVDALGNTTYYNYYGVNNSGSSAVTVPGQSESVLNFTSGGGNSTADTLVTADNYGRPWLQQTRTAPGSGSWETVQYFYDTSGRVTNIGYPRPASAGPGGASGGHISADGYLYDSLGRYTWTGKCNGTDCNSSETNYYYNLNDVMISTGPGQTFSKQLEYNALGRVTSVCELLPHGGGSGCSQNHNPGTNAFTTSYQYDPLGNLTYVNQSGETRSFSYDGVSRMLSETNPETGLSGSGGTTHYAYDAINDGICTVTNPGDQVERIDPAGNYSCYGWDGLHRLYEISYPRGPNTGAMPSKYYVYDLASIWGIPSNNTKGRLMLAYTSVGSAVYSADVFGYDARGETTDAYECAPNGGCIAWYHLQQSYFANGVATAPSGYLGTDTHNPFTHSFGSTLDGKGRPFGIWDASWGNTIIWTNVSYNSADQPLSVQLLNGSSLWESFNYDPYTEGMSQWTANAAGGKQQVGNLTRNQNGILEKLQITDTAVSAGNQTCNYGYDDLARLTSSNCGSVFNQSFSYDAYGNITITGDDPNGLAYNNNGLNNHINGMSYDGMGNITYDKDYNYTYDAEGRPITDNGVQMTFDAFGRAVEQNNSGTYTEFLYSPSGGKFAFMNGSTVKQYFVPLVAGMQAVYNASGLQYYRYTDWQGSARFAATPSGSVYGDQAYSPFGDTYAFGNPIYDFTGQTKDTNGERYDFLLRQYSQGQGRWSAPDPAGMAAVDITNPQTWNRYAYVGNQPLTNVDALGLDDGDDSSEDGSSDWAGGGFVDNSLDDSFEDDLVEITNQAIILNHNPDDPDFTDTVSAMGSNVPLSAMVQVPTSIPTLPLPYKFGTISVHHQPVSKCLGEAAIQGFLEFSRVSKLYLPYADVDDWYWAPEAHGFRLYKDAEAYGPDTAVDITEKVADWRGAEDLANTAKVVGKGLSALSVYSTYTKCRGH